MSSAPPLKVRLIRPGAARSRLEAWAWAGAQSCPNCGRNAHPTYSRPAPPEDGGTWEVTSNCHHCGTILRYLFDAGPGWTSGRADRGEDGDPDQFAARFGPPGSDSALWTARDLAAARDASLPTFEMFEREIARKDAPERGLLLRAAQAAMAALRPMLEMERMGADLPPDHAELRARLVEAARRAGIDVPD